MKEGCATVKHALGVILLSENPLQVDLCQSIPMHCLAEDGYVYNPVCTLPNCISLFLVPISKINKIPIKTKKMKMDFLYPFSSPFPLSI